MIEFRFLSLEDKKYLEGKLKDIVKLKQPFVDWVNSTEKPCGKLTVEKIKRESHVYLIPEHETQQELELIIQDLYREIFEIEVPSFCRDKSLWRSSDLMISTGNLY